MVLNIQSSDTIVLSGKTKFGKAFIEENGSSYRVIKVQRWSEYQLFIAPLKENTEISNIWINLLPKSTNFSIDEVIHSDK